MHPKTEKKIIILKQPSLTQKGELKKDRDMICTNWGCGAEYVEDPNMDKSQLKKTCKHHPGVY